MSDIQFNKIALIGIGLIGSSIARAVKQKHLANAVSITTRSPLTLARAQELDLGTSYTESALECVQDADLVIVSVPVGASGAVAAEIAPGLKKGAILTDVGSTKASVINQMLPHVPEGVHFIAGHPIAGTEHSGPDAGFAELFEGRWAIRYRRFAVSGRPSARTSMKWIRSTTIRCWRSSRTCRISSPTISLARPKTCKR